MGVYFNKQMMKFCSQAYIDGKQYNLGYYSTKEQAIDEIVNQLEKHGMVALGESQAITLAVSRAILENAVA